MNRLLRLKDGTALDMLGLGALAAILAVVVLGAFLIVPIASLYGNPPKRADKALDQSKAIATHEETLDHQVAMIDGRSLFFEPRPPEYVPPTGPGPTVYGGPSLVAYVNGTAWFSDGQKVSEKDPIAQSIKFIRSNAPWSIRVNWKGTEFDVKLFDRTDIANLHDTILSTLGGSSPAPSNLHPPNPAGATQLTPPPDPPGALSGKVASDRPDAPPAARLGPGPGPPDAPAPPPASPAPASGTPGSQPAPASPAPAPAPSPSEPPKDPEISGPNHS